MKKLIYIVLFIFMVIPIYRVLYIHGDNTLYNSFYKYNNTYIYGDNPIRGRILDTNNKVLVDNIGVKALIYKGNTSLSNKLDTVKKLSNIVKFDIGYKSINILKEYYLALNNNGNDLISTKEYNLLNQHKLNNKDIEALKLDRITDSMLEGINYNEAYLYYLINKGYSYQDKVILNNIDDALIGQILSLNIEELSIKMMWERKYLYGDLIRGILGNIGVVNKEVLEHYKGLNVDTNEIVGLSGIEYQYDTILRGKRSKYKLVNNNLVLVDKEVKGEDINLSIDIDLELKIYDILKEEINTSKLMPNTKYFTSSYIMVGNPSNGSILAILGLKWTKNGIKDVSYDIVNTSYTVGSVVKGASISVGYKYNLININEKIQDSCIKLSNQTKKCSWRNLGLINDIDALSLSSNYYQFTIAQRLSNKDFTSNSNLNSTINEFNIYRDTFSMYGLGTLTNIDLPFETPGIKGSVISDDLLLNLSIGQYDTYTLLGLFKYINTLANKGYKSTPHILKNLYIDEGKIDLDDIYIDRIRLGFKSVMDKGTGYSYTNRTFTSAGKTGTSESFIDTNLDNIVDSKVISSSFVMFAPFDNPKYSLVIVSPNISTGETNYKYPINQHVVNKVTSYLLN